MPDPFEIDENEAVVRVTLDIRERDADFLERYAKYRNKLSEARKIRRIRKWNRKSMAESQIAEKCDALREQMGGMFEALGELPSADAGEEEIERYVRRVLAWEKKTEK